MKNSVARHRLSAPWTDCSFDTPSSHDVWCPLSPQFLLPLLIADGHGKLALINNVFPGFPLPK